MITDREPRTLKGSKTLRPFERTGGLNLRVRQNSEQAQELKTKKATALQLKFVLPGDCLLYIISAGDKGILGLRPILACEVDPDKMRKPRVSASKETDSGFLLRLIPDSYSYCEEFQKEEIELK